MITDAILLLFIAPANAMITLMPSFQATIPADLFSYLISITVSLAYIFPISGLMQILLVSITIKGTQILWAIIIRVKSFIPTMGA